MDAIAIYDLLLYAIQVTIQFVTLIAVLRKR